MPITPAEQSRAVADKLSIDGWKDDWHDGPYNEAHRCLTCHRWNIPTHAHFSQPPPDLASPQGADLLMTALLLKIAPVAISFGMSTLTCRISIREGNGFNVKRFDGTGPNWRLALLDAAWRLLCEGK